METLKRKGGVMMAYVSKDMTFGELLMTYYEKCPKIVDDLMEAGMGCGTAELRRIQ